MKEEIIAGLEELVAGLAGDERQQKAWEDFLVDYAAICEMKNLTEGLKAPMSNLLKHVTEGEILDGIAFLASRLDGFPASDFYRVLVELLAEANRENRARISELRDVLTELSTPIIRLWQDVILVPLVGALDSQRAQSTVEKLLESIASTRARMVIVDVTGVPMIDTIVGGFMIEMFTAVKLLGSDVILTGIKPEIAHTLVKLGIDFNMVVVKRDLESALRYAVEVSVKEARADLFRRNRSKAHEE